MLPQGYFEGQGFFDCLYPPPMFNIHQRHTYINGDTLMGTPIGEWSGSGATKELQKTIEKFNESTSKQTRWLLRLTVVLTVLTAVMTLLVGWQIYLQVQPG